MWVLRDHNDLLDEHRYLAHFRNTVPYDAGVMQPVLVVQHIINLTRKYIQQRDAANPTSSRTPKRPKTTEHPIRLANPKIISEGKLAGTIVLNFAHHAQCQCRVCVKDNVTRRPGRRNGSR